MKNVNFFRILLLTINLLLIPLVLNLAGSGVDGEGFHWTVGDFLVMGILIFITGISIELVSRKLKNNRSRMIAVILIVFTLFLVWVQLAVDVISKLILFIYSR